MSKIELRIVDERTLGFQADRPLSPRHRLFLRSVLGGTVDGPDGEWLIPLRHMTRSELLARMVSQFERDDVSVSLVGEAELEAQSEIERRRSFQRTMQRGATFQESGTGLNVGDINAKLDLVGWDFGRRTLRPHQLGSMAHALEVVNAANFSVPGAGKTATALAVMAAHLASETVDAAVIVGPLASFAPWESEADTALPGVLRTRRVRGANAQARTLFYRTAESRDLLMLTYPTVVTDLHELTRLAERLRLMLVVDESHRIKRFRGGQWAPAMVELASAARVRMILSGTPMPQGPLDLWSQLNVLWPKGELTGSRATFKARADSDFEGLVASIRPAFTRTAKSDLGLPEYTVVETEVPATPLQEEIIDLIAGRFRRRLEDADSWQEKLSVLRRARPLRLLQAASNPDLLNQTDGFFALPPIGDGAGTLMQRLANYREQEIPAKFTAALEILDAQMIRGERTVVWTSFVKNIDQFAELCRQRFEVPVLTVDGRVPVVTDDVASLSSDDPGEEVDATREARIREFLGSSLPAVLIANPAACGESISLHSACTTAIYLDRTYDCARYLQSVDRIHRLGLPQDANVTVHLLQTVADGAPTVDGLVHASLAAKQARMELLLEGGELLPAHIPGEVEAASGDDQDLAELLRYLLGA